MMGFFRWGSIATAGVNRGNPKNLLGRGKKKLKTCGCNPILFVSALLYSFVGKEPSSICWIGIIFF